MKFNVGDYMPFKDENGKTRAGLVTHCNPDGTYNIITVNCDTRCADTLTQIRENIEKGKEPASGLSLKTKKNVK